MRRGKEVAEDNVCAGQCLAYEKKWKKIARAMQIFAAVFARKENYV